MPNDPPPAPSPERGPGERAAEVLEASGAWAWAHVEGEPPWLSPPLREALGLGPPGPSDPADLHELVHPDDHPALDEACGRARADGTPFCLRLRLRDRSGASRWADLHGNAVPGDGPPRLAGLAIDAERARRDEFAAARLQRAMDASAEAYFERTAGLDDYVTSPNLTALLGYPPETPGPSADTFLAWVHPEDLPRLRAAMRKAWTAEGEWESVYRLRRADGEYRWVRGRGRSTRDAAGRLLMTGMLGDIHEQVQAQLELQAHRAHLADLVSERTARLEEALAEAQRRRQEADRANEAKSRFLAHMSHEMRTPLNGLLGLVELALRGAESPTQRRYLEVAAQSGQALLQTINDVLDLSRLQASLPPPIEAPFDLAETLAEVVRGVMPLVRSKGLSVRYDWDGDATWFRGDATRVRQVAGNLVGNAAKFTRQGHIALRASLAPRGADRVEVTVRVEDTGPGVDPAQRERIFEPFTQGDESLTRRHGGTGLGLTIARGLARSMGGDVVLESSSPQGSCFAFTLTLPLAPDPAPTPPPGPGHAWLLYTAPAIGEWLQRRFARLGWTSDLVPGVPAAVERAATAAHPELVVVAEHVLAPAVDLAALRDALPQSRITLLIRPDWNMPTLENQARARGMTLTVMPLTPRDLRRLAADAHVHRQAAAPRAAGAPGRHVLLAEDNDVNRMIGAEFLQSLGYAWRGAVHGRDAIDACLAEPPAMVLMDLQMPVMDGFEATRGLRQLQQEGRLPHFPIVALTAHAQASDREQALAAGMDDFLTKPLRLESLREVLERLATRGERPPG